MQVDSPIVSLTAFFSGAHEMIKINISSWLEELRNWIGLIFLLFNRHHSNAAGLYELMSTKNILSEKTLFINLGYWENACEYDEACYALARILADAAEMSKDDAVLDAGFGFAEQDLFWTRTFRPASIVGLNVTKLQVEIATRRVRDAGLVHRIQLIAGSATDMPIADQSVTKVVALESAFHFQTRQRFFEEAFRVLKPRGRIALADLLILPLQSVPGSKKWLLNHLGRAAWQIPRCNVDSIDSYAEKLRRAGFTDIRIRSIRDQVLLPFRCYARNRLNTSQPESRMSRSMKLLWWTVSSGAKRNGALDYVLVSASRP